MYVCGYFIFFVCSGALAEGMALADSAGLRQSDLVEVMSYTPMTSQLVLSKAKQITDCTFNTNMPLGNMQKDLTLSLALGGSLVFSYNWYFLTLFFDETWKNEELWSNWFCTG